MVKYFFGPRNVLHFLLYLKLQSRWNQREQEEQLPPLPDFIRKPVPSKNDILLLLLRFSEHPIYLTLKQKPDPTSEQNNNWCYMNSMYIRSVRLWSL